MSPLVRVFCPSCQASWDHDPGSEAEGSTPLCPRCGSVASPSTTEPSEFGSSPTSNTSSERLVDLPTPIVPARPQTAGRRIGRFELRRVIGEGGYGRVYLAYDPKLDREVALKVLKARRVPSKALKRFFRESQAAAKLGHPSVVMLHDAGYDDSRCWIAYQLVDGEPLSRLIASEVLPVDRAVEVLIGVARALEHAHARGVFHRDLKPANILIDQSGHARLTDFGLARQIHVDSELTSEGMVIGTPAYIPPEQAAGHAHMADARSDIYSLGVIMYEMLCGHHPHDAKATTPRWQVSPRTSPPSPRAISRAIPSELDRICMRAMSVDPEDRYQSATEMVAALESWQNRSSRRSARTLQVLLAAALAAWLCIGIALFARSLQPGPTFLNSREILRNPSTSAHVPNRPAAGRPPATSGVSTREIAVVFVGNRSSNVFHRENCKNLRVMLDRNRITFSGFKDATTKGFSPCQTCRPEGEGTP